MTYAITGLIAVLVAFACVITEAGAGSTTQPDAPTPRSIQQ